MKRRMFHFIMITALFFCSVSCGIPNIYVPSSSDIKITTTSEKNGKFTIHLSDTVINELRDGSPTLYFLYTISEESQSSSFSSAISNFNSTYCSETGGEIIGATSGSAASSYTSGSGDTAKRYGVYLLSVPSWDLEQVNETVLTLCMNTYDNDDTLMLVAEDGNVLQRSIKRYNSSVFKKSAVNTEEEIVDFSVSNYYTVKVYAVVSCQFDSYNNIYNTKISSSSPILEFTLSE